MSWNYLPLVNVSSLGEKAPVLLREFIARNVITLAYRPGEAEEASEIKDWYGGTLLVRPSLRGLTAANVGDLINISRDIKKRHKSGARTVLLNMPESVARSLATAANLTFATPTVVGDKLEIITVPPPTLPGAGVEVSDEHPSTD